MVASEFSFRLQHGMAGGFAPPTPTAIHTVTRPKDASNLAIASAVHDNNTASLQDASPKQLQVNESTSQLVNELHSILKDLPTEDPPGSEDIYGRDISIAWGSDDLQWMNGAPQGCGGGKSSVVPTDEQKAKFDRAVEIINILVAT